MLRPSIVLGTSLQRFPLPEFHRDWVSTFAGFGQSQDGGTERNSGGLKNTSLWKLTFANLWGSSRPHHCSSRCRRRTGNIASQDGLPEHRVQVFDLCPCL